MRCSLVRLGATAFCLLASLGPSRACELSAIELRLSAADDHLFWSEFWNDTDPQEAAAELGYCAHELRQAIRLAQDPDCDKSRRSALLGQIASRRLTSVRLAVSRMTTKDVAERR
ncbi:hypothetical protein GCM10007036_26330 [Alsobacter metallidurans]|uniref:UrcA family protein n=1 Tax=Alsobacter metallidurans TaxID=340221 RepID=A0A917I7B8_9HYPH|nr:hypothetical protein [Alsobacter metallidurans]GGH21792.1 hypothetical protein GCM10007036_26330 [Alsobacter metallidurans]